MNKEQKRGLTIALRVVEENIQNIEQILNSKTHKGILYDTNWNISLSMITDLILEMEQLLGKTNK